MAAQTLSQVPWADGTTVGVYPAVSVPAGSDTPSGTAVASAVVAGGVVSFSGLSPQVRYYAYAGGRGVRFLIPVTSTEGDRARIEALEADLGSAESRIDALDASSLATPGVTTDQGASIQTLIDAANANFLAGNGPTRVRFNKPGVYTVSLKTIPSQTQFAAGVWMRAGVTLDLTGVTLKLIDNATLPGSAEQGFIVGNVYTAGQFTEPFYINGGTLDGNGNTQLTSLTPAGGVFNGALVSALHLNRVRNPKIEGVTAKNVWGTSAAPPIGSAPGGESFAFMNYLCEGVTYEKCVAAGTDITDSATGWNDTYSHGTKHIDCVARDFKYGMGFSTYHSGAASYSDCWAYKCIGSGSAGGAGFNLEKCDHVAYSDCFSGGRLTSRDSTTDIPYGHVSSQEKLGNRNGWAISGGYMVTIGAGCQSAYNTNRNVFVDLNVVGTSTFQPRVSNRVSIYGKHLHCGQGTDRWNDNVEITAATITSGTVTGTLTSGSKNVTTLTGTTGTIVTGQSITGTGIPVGTTITEYDSGAATMKLSAVATASGATALSTLSDVYMFAKASAFNSALNSATTGFVIYGNAPIHEYQSGGSGHRFAGGLVGGWFMRWFALGGTGAMNLGLNWLGQVVTGGRARKRTAVVNNYTIATTDDIVGVTSTAAARTLTLPDGATAGTNGAAEFEVVDESNAAATNNITVQRAGTDTFLGGATTKVINTNGGGLRIYWNGTVWVARVLGALA